MGTSTGFSPSGPQWGESVKDAKEATAPDAPPYAIPAALNSHIRARQRSPGTGDKYYSENTMSGGRGTGGGTGGGSGGGKAFGTARSTARNIGGFINAVQSAGLRKTLENWGLDHLSDKPLADVLDGVAVSLVEQAGFIEEQDALAAVGRVFDDLKVDCESLDEFEAKLQGLTDTHGLTAVFSDFFRYVLVEDFMRHYSTRLQEKYSDSQIDRMRNQVEDLLFARLQFDLDYQDLNMVDWSSPKADELIKSIQIDTFDICMEASL